VTGWRTREKVSSGGGPDGGGTLLTRGQPPMFVSKLVGTADGTPVGIPVGIPVGTAVAIDAKRWA
jgi:hypothetical protein